MDKMIMCDVKWILLMNPQRIITCSQLYVVFPLHDAAQFNSKRYWYFTQFHVYCNFPPIQMGFILDTPGGHQFTFELVHRQTIRGTFALCQLTMVWFYLGHLNLWSLCRMSVK